MMGPEHGLRNGMTNKVYHPTGLSPEPLQARELAHSVDILGFHISKMCYMTTCLFSVFSFQPCCAGWEEWKTLRLFLMQISGNIDFTEEKFHEKVVAAQEKIDAGSLPGRQVAF